MAKKNTILGEQVKIKKEILEVLCDLVETLDYKRRETLKEYRSLKDENGNYILDDDGSKKWGYVDLTEENTKPEEWERIQIKLRAFEEVGNLLDTLV